MKNFLKPAREKFEAGLRKVERAKVVAGASVATMLGFTVPASATQINPNATTEGVVGGILDVIFQVAFYFGIGIAAIGVVSFLFAYKDDNAESQSRGLRMALVGTALIGIKGLIRMTGLIQ